MGLDPDTLTEVFGAGGALDDIGNILETPAMATEVLGAGGPLEVKGNVFGTPAGALGTPSLLLEAPEAPNSVSGTLVYILGTFADAWPACDKLVETLLVRDKAWVACNEAWVAGGEAFGASAETWAGRGEAWAT